MSIYLGNLKVKDIEDRLEVTFSEEARKFMESTRQNSASPSHGYWHCFDIPFAIVCGDIETARNIHATLAPLADGFKTPIQIVVQKGGRS